MSSFREFVNQNKDIKEEQSNSDKKLSEEDMSELIDRYSKLNENELLTEFMKMTYEKKKKGELNKQELNNVKNTLTPFLNDQQKRNLDNIIDMVDDVK